MHDDKNAPVTVLAIEMSGRATRFYDRERRRVENEFYTSMYCQRTGKTPRQLIREDGRHIPYEQRVATRIAQRRQEKENGSN
ncbi:hypothetical protein [Burkholderia orbicola]|uniref:hypothetical protein n=1 Tax=Burkholderia orbicola TaxID=2978683 RepID=UPI00264EBDDE|nr:hypothetical protein [Burkholderia orbicola]MDN7533866.1 hypothetical protein [Burkholderia orbicola]